MNGAAVSMEKGKDIAVSNVLATGHDRFSRAHLLVGHSLNMSLSWPLTLTTTLSLLFHHCLCVCTPLSLCACMCLRLCALPLMCVCACVPCCCRGKEKIEVDAHKYQETPGLTPVAHGKESDMSCRLHADGGSSDCTADRDREREREM